MKRITILFLLLLCVCQLRASEVAKTVAVSTAGDLTNLLTSDEKSTITHLTLTGVINQKDFNVMNSYMPSLSHIDLSRTTIQAYSTYDANTIPKKAFYQNTTLVSFVFPSTVETIGQASFYGCVNLASELSIPTSVSTLESSVFGNCTSLTGTLTIPSSITSLGAAAFFGCSGLTGELHLSSYVTSIGSSAFLGCSGFSSLLLYIPPLAL